MPTRDEYIQLLPQQRNCVTCKYFTAIAPQFGCCSYWEIKGQPRPCEPGDKCSVKVRKTQETINFRKTPEMLRKRKK